MLIVADAHIPFLVEAVRKEWPEVQICPLEPEKIDASSVRDADVLIVRTRTRVNEALLSGSRVRMVCTATIGYDHIDTAYCDAHAIRWTACPGCNAQAVCDYIEEAIEEVQRDEVLSTKGTTIGVVGVGHVGSKVAQMAERRGMKVLLNDPPKGIGVPLDEIARQCDIITFHVPLTRGRDTDRHPKGIQTEYPTYHMCDEEFLGKCKPEALIINAARGGVVDEMALVRSGHPYILDTWENEPDIHPDVLSCALFASMHIAGYSTEGKRNASRMCLDAIADTYGLPKIPDHVFSSSSAYLAGDTAFGWLSRITGLLKACPDQFEMLRKSYALR